ncbi:hypothetical protein CCGE525_24960 (plasmid) [Rhizobium jaguaris]|uniref:Uncharacterized protein n=1 Tax=Rhizobium jaguaris TaxID=1312183 RepID=A0A387FY17_9HYPH|nr:hypothetical protein CCGE525_24960 [Rhizobium jaguaris]
MKLSVAMASTQACENPPSKPPRTLPTMPPLREKFVSTFQILAPPTISRVAFGRSINAYPTPMRPAKDLASTSTLLATMPLGVGAFMENFV